MKLFLTALVVASSLLLVPRANAQPLADRIPADAVIYVGWRGEADLGDAYQQSHMKAMADLVGLKVLMRNNLAAARMQIAARDGDARAAAFDRARRLASLTWQKQAAFFFRDVDMADPRNPKPSGAFLWDAGEDKAEMLGILNSLATEVPPQAGAALRAFEDGNLVGIVVGEPEHIARALDPKTPRISTSKPFQTAMGNVQQDGAMVAYADVESLLGIIDALVKAHGDEDQQARLGRMQDAVGVMGIKSIAMTAGFDGKEWATQTFVAAPAPRKGLLSVFDGKAVSDDTLDLAPKSATWVTATHGDASKLIDSLRQAVMVADPNAAQAIDNMIENANKQVGFDIEGQLLRSLGPDWLVFTDPMLSGRMGMGFVAQNRLKDAPAAKQAVDQLAALGMKHLNEIQKENGAIQGPLGGPIQVSLDKFALNEMEIYALLTPMMSPALSVHDGRLMLGSSMQNITQAASYTKEQHGKIRDNPAFKAALERIGAKDPIGIKFVNLPETAPRMYQTIQTIIQMGGMLAPQLQLNQLAMRMPPFHQIQPHLTPSIKASWTDDTGFYMRSIEPFPGSGVLGPAMSNMSVIQMMLGGMLLAPAVQGDGAAQMMPGIL